MLVRQVVVNIALHFRQLESS